MSTIHTQVVPQLLLNVCSAEQPIAGLSVSALLELVTNAASASTVEVLITATSSNGKDTRGCALLALLKVLQAAPENPACADAVRDIVDGDSQPLLASLKAGLVDSEQQVRGAAAELFWAVDALLPRDSMSRRAVWWRHSLFPRPPGPSSPGSWLRYALGTCILAAQGPLGGCGVAVRPGCQHTGASAARCLRSSTRGVSGRSTTQSRCRKLPRAASSSRRTCPRSVCRACSSMLTQSAVSW